MAERAVAAEASLSKSVGALALTAAVVNVTVGGSIFALPGSLAASLGAWAPWAFVAGALLFLPIVLCFAAAGSRIGTSGGAYRYVQLAFGALPGFAVAAIFWTSNVAGSASMAAILAGQLSQRWPALGGGAARTAFLFSVYAALVLLNARSVRLGAVAVLAFALAKMLPLFALVAAALPSVQPARLVPSGPPGVAAVGSALVLVVFAYSGVETALAPSGELRDPGRAVPRAALAGVAIVVLAYVGLQTVALGVLGPSLPGHEAPLVELADRLVPGAGLVVLATAAVSLVGVLQGDLLGSSRLIFALARDGYLPSALAGVGARHVPTRAVVAHALVAWVIASAGSYEALALVSGGAFCLVYLGGCAAAWRLERRGICETERPWRLPGGGATALAAIVALLLVLAALRPQEWAAIAWAAAFVCALYALRRWRDRAPTDGY
jgi:amino acid transporter